MSKVTAIISAYFAEKYLEGRIQNLQEQDPKPEILIICQANSREEDIALPFLGDGTSLIHTEDIPTIYAVWNKAITFLQKRGGCEYVTNANCDDRLYPGALKKLADTLDHRHQAAMAYFNIDIVNEIGGKPVNLFNWAEGGLKELLQGCFLGPMPMWRLNLHEKYGLFDAEMHSAGDYEFWLRIAAGGERFQKIPETLGAYLNRDDSAGNRQSLRAIWETARARARYRK
jgi:glycosyltransferase involved in cell wall biosynthesis